MIRLRAGHFGAAVMIVVLVALAYRPQNENEEAPTEIDTDNYIAVTVENQSLDFRADRHSENQETVEVATDSPYERDAMLMFPSGRIVEVRLKAFKPEMPPFRPSVILSESYYALAAEAEKGDIPSARYLGFRLRRCQNAFANRDLLENAITVLETENILTYPAGAYRKDEAAPLGLDRTRIIERLERRFEVCEGITESQRQSAQEWSYLAASKGDYFAARDLIESQGFTQESFEIWQAAWKEGYSMALHEMVYYFNNGVPESIGGESDLFQAYAHNFAYSKVREASFASGSDYAAVSAQDGLSNMGARLSATRQAQAEELAADIIEGNPNCCVMWTLEERD